MSNSTAIVRVTPQQVDLLERVRRELEMGHEISVELGTVERLFEEATGQPFSIDWLRGFLTKCRALTDAVDNARARVHGAELGGAAVEVPAAVWEELLRARGAMP